MLRRASMMVLVVSAMLFSSLGGTSGFGLAAIYRLGFDACGSVAAFGPMLCMLLLLRGMWKAREDFEFAGLSRLGWLIVAATMYAFSFGAALWLVLTT